ncbi:MAG: hypothetical protein HZC40_07165 [Chloroflexi bacterium]|nr:hypothetical protein [Chloroflexota bacterium]
MTAQTRTDYLKALDEIVAMMSPARLVQLYEFALFLKEHPLPFDETLAQIAQDEAVWDAQFAATDDAKLAELVASVEQEINGGKTLPMFNERGEFVERK